MPYSSVLFGLVAAGGWGTADYLSRHQSSKVGSYNTVVYSHLVTFSMLALCLPLLTPGFSAAPFPVALLALMGALNFMAFIFLYRAFHLGVVSVVAPIAYTYPVVTAVLSVLVVGTVLRSYQIAAISAVMAGVVLLSTRFSELRAAGVPAKITAGVGSAIGASVFFGIVYIGVGYATPIVGFVLPAVILRAVGSGVGVAAAPVLHEDISPKRSSFSRVILAMGLLETIGFLSFSYGLSSSADSLPIVTALSGMGGAVAVGYAMYFLRERLEANQVIGLMLSLAGVFALLYLGG